MKKAELIRLKILEQVLPKILNSSIVLIRLQKRVQKYNIMMVKDLGKILQHVLLVGPDKFPSMK